MYRAFSSAVEASEKDKRPPDDDRLRCSPDGAPTPTGKRGRRKDEFEHVICQQAGPVMIMAGLLRVEGSRFRIMLERLELFMIVEQMPV